ncbi:MAG: protoheme IX farnesyltransferase [Acidobacteria bacterium]|nr:protoheme IX farnesyltransferase [Acidobacteriota bacterium]
MNGVRGPWWRHVRGAMVAYLELTKIRLAALVLLTTFVGFVFRSGSTIDLGLLAWTLFGTGLTAAGSLALNQWIEAGRDALMERTRMRPIPAGLIRPRMAVGTGFALTVLGVATLALKTNLLTAALGLLVVLIYVVAYTPLKPVSSLCTLVGAFCGAIPPLMGWTAAGSLARGGWILATILFVWQIPHFLAIAWIYREDYVRGGFRMLPAYDPSGSATSRMVVLYSAALLPISLGLTAARLTGWVYSVGAATLGLSLLYLGITLYRSRTHAAARRLFLGSVLYLAALIALMIVDRNPDPQTTDRDHVALLVSADGSW